MAKDTRDRDNGNATSGQSKRPAAPGHRDDNADRDDWDSAVSHGSSDVSAAPAPPPPQPQPLAHRPKPHHQKHVVGGGTGRLHPRVPSSKALHKHHVIGPSATKPVRRQSSPAPPTLDRAAFASPPTATATTTASTSSHRRASSDLRLSGNSTSATSLKKNQSASSLKRNRSLADVVTTKRSSRNGGVALKRSNSNPGAAAASKKQPPAAKSSVHFDIGDDDEDDEDGDEWVDASSSASPYISRRGSVVSVGQSSSTKLPDGGSDHHLDATAALGQQSPRRLNLQQQQQAHRVASHTDLPPTARLLQRLASGNALTRMSAESATGESVPVSRRQKQVMSGSVSRPDSSASTMSNEADLAAIAAQRRMMMIGSSGGDGSEEMTSRFVTAGSSGAQGSGSGGKFYAPDPRLSRQSDDDGSLPNRTQSLAAMSDLRRREPPNGGYLPNDEASMTSDDDAGGVRSLKNKPSPSKSRIGMSAASPGYIVPPAEKSRTQQKLNLQRASSTLDPSHLHHHQSSAVVGPLVGGQGYEARDPRINKILERTGMEYLVVRRHQNPVARSIDRISHLLDVELGRRIPQPNGSAKPGHVRHASDYVSATSRLSQSYRNLDGAPAGSSSSGSMRQQQQQQRPNGPRRVFSSIRASGAGSSVDTDDGRRLAATATAGEGGLSGASAGDGDDNTTAILRSLWEKGSMDLSASQD